MLTNTRWGGLKLAVAALFIASSASAQENRTLASLKVDSLLNVISTRALEDVDLASADDLLRLAEQAEQIALEAGDSELAGDVWRRWADVYTLANPAMLASRQRANQCGLLAQQGRLADAEQCQRDLMEVGYELFRSTDSILDERSKILRRAIAHYEAAGAADKEAEALGLMVLTPGSTARDSMAILTERARQAYGTSENAELASEFEEQAAEVALMVLMRRAMSPQATRATADSVLAMCRAHENPLDSLSCDDLRAGLAASFTMRGEIDNARDLLVEGPGEVSDSLATHWLVLQEATIGHAHAIQSLIRSFLIGSSTGSDPNPLGLLDAEVNDVQAAASAAEAAHTLARVERRLFQEGRRRDAGQVAGVRAALYSIDGDEAEAERVLRAAVATAVQPVSREDRGLHGALAEVLERRGAITEALASVRTAVRLYGDSVTQEEVDDGQLAIALYRLARLAPSEAAGVAEARAALVRADNLESRTSPARAGVAPHVLSHMQRYFTEAEMLRRTARWEATASLRSATLDSAHILFESAATIAGTVRAGFRSEHDAVTWADQWSALYDGWISLWIERAQIADAPGDTAALAALGVAELGRAQALRDLLRIRGDTGDLLNGTEYTEAAARSSPATFATELLRRVRRTDAAVLYLHRTRSGAVHSWLAPPSGSMQLFPARDLPNGWLDRHVAAIGHGMRLAFARTDTLSAARRDSVAVWKEKLTTALDTLSILLPEDALAMLRDSTELVVVANDILGQIPFQALRVRHQGVRPHLLVRFAVRQAPSLAAMIEAEAIPERYIRGTSGQTSTGGVLVAAWPGDDPPLDWAMEEASVVAQLHGTRPLPPDSAYESHVWDALSTARIAHLVAHGRASGDPRWVRDSTGIWLRPGPSSASAGEADGFLSMRDILERTSDQPLLAELVVLSACDTGLGHASRSEGMVSLQRALLAAGTRSALVSLWLVDDRWAATLMESFWRHWLQDPDHPTKAQALRRAQLELSRNAPPYYWAAFQVAGAR